jgi:hypothetical protein
VTIEQVRKLLGEQALDWVTDEGDGAIYVEFGYEPHSWRGVARGVSLFINGAPSASVHPQRAAPKTPVVLRRGREVEKEKPRPVVRPVGAVAEGATIHMKNTERLALIDNWHLSHGAHAAPESPESALAFVAGEPWSDHPQCTEL